MRPAQSRQRDALDALYRDHHRWLHNLLRSRSGCSETAADLAQDTFLRLLSRDQDPLGLTHPRAYLGRIARGLLANHWRRRDIEQAYLEALRQRPEALAPSPEEHHLVMETLYEVDAFLVSLPDKARRVFLMSRLDRLRYAEIGERLGISERMVKKYMARATLQYLRLDNRGDGR
ncbi:sigma-70 family RNA polymerase sigma factor [Alloalcanivorax sp. C16-2]|uniref:sigma-70 family RNA polymerase sigma factor n=1 Tax=Alloalcanivorax sp. C16-2 TaxID=3390052 RepID=UPI0039705FB9